MYLSIESVEVFLEHYNTLPGSVKWNDDCCVLTSETVHQPILSKSWGHLAR